MRVAAVVCFAGSTANYFDDDDIPYGRFVNAPDVYQSYIGAKYSPEHRYTDLYRATVLAQLDNGEHIPPYKIRNLDTHTSEALAEVKEHRDRVRAHFSDERWAALRADVGMFRSMVPRSTWSEMVNGTGHDATPVWNLVGRTVAEAVPLESPAGVHLLTAIDLALLCALGVGVGATLGWEAALLLLAFVGLNVFGSFTHIKGAFLRLDWMVAGVGAVLALRAQRGALAGVLVAWAAMVRVFPLFLVLGPALLLAEQLIRRRPSRVLVRFFVGFAAAVLALFALTCATEGLELWSAFVHTTRGHSGDLASDRVGLFYALLDPDATALTRPWAKRSTLVLAIPALIAFAAAVRKRPPAIALAWGVLPVFVLAEATFSSYVMLTIPMAALLVPGDSKDGDGHDAAILPVGLILLTSVLGYAREPALGHGFHYVHELSIALCVVFFGALIALLPGLGGTPRLLHTLSRGSRTHPLRASVLGGVGLLTVAASQYGGAVWLELHHPLASLRPNDAERELVFVGDIMLSRNVAKSLSQTGRTPADLFDHTREWIAGADFAVGNLECPISVGTEPIPGKKYVFNADPRAVSALEGAGFDLVSLANNHTLDHGPEALRQTESLLDDSTIDHVGLSTEGAPQTPHIVDLDGIRVGTLAYCDPKGPTSCARKFDAVARGPAKLTYDRVRADLVALRDRVDIIVVQLHWGTEYKLHPGGRQRQLTKFLVRHGADIVAGHHPHVQQDAQWVDGALAIYSMGNFVFDQRQPNTQESRLYRVVVGREGVRRASFLPLYLPHDDWAPTPDAENFVPVPSPVKLVRTLLDLW